MTRTTVAIVEDDAGMRERVARVIRADPELDLKLAATTGQEMLAFLRSSDIHVLLVDLGLPDISGLEVIRQCRRCQPDCAVMVLSIFGDETSMVQAFECGASGYLLKDGTEAELAKHIRHLSEGGSPLSPAIASQLLRRWRDSASPSTPSIRTAPKSTERVLAPPEGSTRGRGAPRMTGPLPEQLSQREFEVLDLVARGFTYNEVAARMEIATTTVQTHIRNIYGKLDVHNKSEAVFEARSLGWLS